MTNATAATTSTISKLAMPIPRVEKQPAEDDQAHQEYYGADHLSLSSLITSTKLSNLIFVVAMVEFNMEICC